MARLLYRGFREISFAVSGAYPRAERTRAVYANEETTNGQFSRSYERNVAEESALNLNEGK